MVGLSAEELGPVDGADGFVEAVVVVHLVKGEVREELLGQAADALQGDEVVLAALVDDGRDGDWGGGISGEIGPGEGGGEEASWANFFHDKRCDCLAMAISIASKLPCSSLVDRHLEVKNLVHQIMRVVGRIPNEKAI